VVPGGLGSKDASSWRWMLAAASIWAAFAWCTLRRRSSLDESGLGLILSLFSAAATSAVVLTHDGGVCQHNAVRVRDGLSSSPWRRFGRLPAASCFLWQGAMLCYCARGIVGPTII
jgi:hypothetical protein